MQQLALDDAPVLARFMAKVRVNPSTGCWEWKGSISDSRRYGAFKVNGKVVLAHRWAYEALVGPIPTGKELDHLCRNCSCVSPAHVEPVTHAENVRRVPRTPPAACPRGHPYDERNTYTYPNGNRRCRACNRDFMRRIACHVAERPLATILPDGQEAPA